MIHLSFRRAISPLAALMLVTGACSDAPSSPPLQSREAVPVTPGVGNLPLLAPALPPIQPGQSIERRQVLHPNGTRFLIETVLNVDGLPAEIRVSRNDQTIARFSNHWERALMGFELSRQQMVRYLPSRQPINIDSRQVGTISTLATGAVQRAGIAPGAFTANESGLLFLARTRTSVDGEADGPCDEQARNVEAALDDWLLSVLAVAGSLATSSPVAVFTAYAYQVKKYRDVTRAEAKLDECVEAAGKRRRER